MKEIKEFIDMMEDDFEFTEKRKDSYTYSHIVYKSIMESHEYQALKAKLAEMEESKERTVSSKVRLPVDLFRGGWK